MKFFEKISNKIKAIVKQNSKKKATAKKAKKVVKRAKKAVKIEKKIQTGVQDLKTNGRKMTKEEIIKKKKAIAAMKLQK